MTFHDVPLPVVIRLSQRISHAFLSISIHTAELGMAHKLLKQLCLFDGPGYMDI